MYYVGDKVRVWDKQEEDRGGICWYVSGMFKYAGCMATIAFVDSEGSIKLDIDDQRFWWEDRMLRPYEEDNIKIPDISLEDFYSVLLIPSVTQKQ